jgi:hypothetical protein
LDVQADVIENTVVSKDYLRVANRDRNARTVIQL